METNMTPLAAKRSSADRKTDDDTYITQQYGTENPEFSYICGGLRRIGVNPLDRRARKMLLRKGVRYYSKNQFFIYVCIKKMPIDIFLDIGTNYGECLFSIPLYSHVKARGFEPNPYLNEYLDKSRLYNDDLKNVEIQNRAVSDKSGNSTKFFIDTVWSGKSSLHRDKKKGIQEIVVETTTVDLEVEKAGGGKTILAKIDVEGFEPSVIRGAEETYNNDTNLIFLMEFDEDFLERSGTDPEIFFHEITTRFGILELRGGGLVAVEDYNKLKHHHADKKKIHTDLVLTRFYDLEIEREFISTIRDKSFKEIRSEFW